MTHGGDALSHGGHDFWLTRNGHGAGFWDGDWIEPAATALTAAAHRFPAMPLYTGADELGGELKIYVYAL